MELIAVPLPLQRFVDGVDPVGHHEHGAVRLLGQKVAQGPVEAAGQADPLAVAGDEGEGALDLQHVAGIFRKEKTAGVLHGHVEDVLVGVGDEVADAGDGLLSQGGILLWRGPF
jgi:hypothetical protein